MATLGTRDTPSGVQDTHRNEFSWDQLEEDEHGRLRASGDGMRQRQRRQKMLMSIHEDRGQAIQRGMIRYLELVFDVSKAASMNDMRPIRSAAMFHAAEEFIRSFFDENPLSQLGIVLMKDGVAKQLTDLSSSPEMHIEKLKANLDTGGSASIGNALDVATDVLKNIPPYGHREVLCLLASLSTCDPGDVMSSIDNAVKNNVRVSVVGLAAEVHVFKMLSLKTGGSYAVALDQEHMEDLVLAHATPPPSLKGKTEKHSLIHVGFPSQSSSAAGAACFVGTSCVLQSGAFICPRCRARTTEVPSECHICSLTLIASPHLARSYHHMFPVELFDEVNDTSSIVGKPCFSCHLVFNEQSDLDSSEISQCGGCLKYFCLDCDEYIHGNLHTCPGCELLHTRHAPCQKN